MEFIRELIDERWIKVRVAGPISQNKQTDLEITKEGVLSVTFFPSMVYWVNWEMEWMGHFLQMIWRYTLQQEV